MMFLFSTKAVKHSNRIAHRLGINISAMPDHEREQFIRETGQIVDDNINARDPLDHKPISQVNFALSAYLYPGYGEPARARLEQITKSAQRKFLADLFN